MDQESKSQGLATHSGVPTQEPRPRQKPSSEGGPALLLRKAEEWPEFRRYFLKLTENEHFPPAIMMAQLREHLITKEAKVLIAGKTDPTEAWRALNKRFGDKELAVVNVKYKLASLDRSRRDG